MDQKTVLDHCVIQVQSPKEFVHTVKMTKLLQL